MNEKLECRHCKKHVRIKDLIEHMKTKHPEISLTARAVNEDFVLFPNFNEKSG